MWADFSEGCIIYVDESGAFARQSTYDGVVSLVVPDCQSALAEVRTFVESVEADAHETEKRKDEVKGSALRLERFDGIIRFVCHQGLFVGPSCINRQSGTRPHAGPFLPADIRRDHLAKIQDAKAYVQSRELRDRADQIAEAIRSASEEDLWYGLCVWLSIHGVCRQLARRPLPQTMTVVFDPRLGARYQPMLEYFAGFALLPVIQGNFQADRRWRIIPAFLLGAGENPFAFRPPFPPGQTGHELDRCGLQLADWLTYLHTAANREGFYRRDDYRGLLDRYDSYHLPG